MASISAFEVVLETFKTNTEKHFSLSSWICLGRGSKVPSLTIPNSFPLDFATSTQDLPSWTNLRPGFAIFLGWIEFQLHLQLYSSWLSNFGLWNCISGPMLWGRNRWFLASTFERLDLRLTGEARAMVTCMWVRSAGRFWWSNVPTGNPPHLKEWSHS